MELTEISNQVESAGNYIRNLKDYFLGPELWSSMLAPELWSSMIFTVIKVILIIVIARIVNRVANASVRRIVSDRKNKHLRFDVRRATTIGALLQNVITYVVNFIAILLILSQFNFNLAPLLAGAGVLGLAIGFGAQSIVKDIITGFFIIFEDQFAVGDVIQTGTFKGTVEVIGLRVTTIRAWTGEIYIIPNSTIQAVTNYSIYNSFALVDLLFSYEEDISKAIIELDQIFLALHEKNDNVVSLPVVKGIQSLGESNLSVRISIECRPNTRQDIIRDLNQEIEQKLKLSQMPTVRGAAYLPDEKG
ncbi:MAG: mechanosensitive ion channel family protein [Gorillibacterium sp.]|nr:mechanosensitive ion channel family protein [Gorillibacterium sp.]